MRDALIDKSAFEPRITRLKERVAHLETQVQAVGQAVEQQRELRLVIGQLADFAATVRDRLDHLEWETCQAILRALVKRVEIDHDQVQVIFRIGPCPLPPELSTPVSQDCERCVGAILVNLETHRILDLLPDRSAPTAATWMQGHPEIELVSRDRSKEFATAVAQGAPQAVQVLDRFHLMQHLVEQVDVVVSRCVADLRRRPPRPTSKSASPAPTAEWKPTPPPHVTHRQDARQQARQARYEQVLALRQEGCNSVEIAQRLGMPRRTVHDWVRHALARQPPPQASKCV